MAVHPKKTYVLDTNVLLHDPRSLFGFDEHDVVIPLTVIEEVDKFKKDLDEVGRNARTVSRTLDDLRATGSLRDGVASPGRRAACRVFGDTTHVLAWLGRRHERQSYPLHRVGTVRRATVTSCW